MLLMLQCVDYSCKCLPLSDCVLLTEASRSDHEERPRAYIALKSEQKGASTERDIENWIAERVAKHKRLSGGVVFIDEVPKSPSGKIQRKILREWAKKDAEVWQKPREVAKL